MGVGGQRWVSQGFPAHPCLSASGSVPGSSWDSPTASGTRWAGLCCGDSHPGLPALLSLETRDSGVWVIPRGRSYPCPPPWSTPSVLCCASLLITSPLERSTDFTLTKFIDWVNLGAS